VKTIALLGSILLFASCSSSNSIVDETTFNCGSGQAVDIMAGLEMPQMRGHGAEYGGQRAKLMVNVFNNSHGEITVTNVSADQIADPDATYVFDRGNLTADVTIADGEEHTFELPMTGRTMGQPDFSRRTPPSIVLAVRVKLSTGDSYLCRYEIASPI
jgi:hypothetical protein